MSQLSEELEAVEAILMEGIERQEDGDKIERVTIRLHPLTASDEEKKFVALTLDFSFPEGYPDKPPDIEFRNPRGLRDSLLSSHLSSLRTRAEEFAAASSPVIFELIELTREFLTESNDSGPAGNCAVCLADIVGGDDFVRTDCYHYFHAVCLGRYAWNCQTSHTEFLSENPEIPGVSACQRSLSITCPVCRDPLQEIKTDQWLKAKPPTLGGDEGSQYKSSPEMVELQRRMRTLFSKQLAKGGIIDVEAESKKFLVTTNQSDDTGDLPRNDSSSSSLCSRAVEEKVKGDPVKKEVDEEELEPSGSRRRWQPGGGRPRGHYSHMDRHRNRRSRPDYHCKRNKEEASQDSTNGCPKDAQKVGEREVNNPSSSRKRLGKGRGRGRGASHQLSAL